MPDRQNKSNRFSSMQWLIFVAFFLVFAAIQLWRQSSDTASVPPPTVPPAQPVPRTDTPREPGGAPSTLTPGTVEMPPLDSLGEFDYFLLALSWSPDYCATSGGDDPQQCSIGRKLGFVLHGLWPQYNRGYPSDCTREKLTEEVKKQFPGLYPSEKLYDHEWEKHGTCTGLSTTAYLTLSKHLKESVTIPVAYRSPEAPFRTTVKQMLQEFTAANPGFASTSFAVNCSSNGRYLKELHVCFSRQGQPTACGADVQKDAQKSCQSPDFLVRNIR
jgi:ribonuclease T2